MSRAPQSGAGRALKQIARAPALRALLLQLLAYPLMLLSVYLLARLGQPLPLAGVALLQGMIAGGLTWLAKLAPWWRLIQLLFPLVLLVGVALHLPPLPFLLIFLLLLGWYWSTFRTQVPFYPSGPAVWRAVETLLPDNAPRLVDIGSGLGGLVLELARRRPDGHFTGIELAPLPWLASRLRALFTHSRARLVRGDYDNLDFADYDVVFAYLSPAAMLALWLKARAEMAPGALLLSYEFEIPGQPPDRSIFPTPNGPALHVWQF